MTNIDFEKFLDSLSNCFLEANIEQWRGLVRMPLVLITEQDTLTLTDNVAVDNSFWQYRMWFNIMNVTNIIRSQKSLEECRDGAFLGSYETHLFNGSSRVVDPYTSTALLRRESGGLIKVGSIYNALSPGQYSIFERNSQLVSDETAA